MGAGSAYSLRSRITFRHSPNTQTARLCSLTNTRVLGRSGRREGAGRVWGNEVPAPLLRPSSVTSTGSCVGCLGGAGRSRVPPHPPLSLSKQKAETEPESLVTTVSAQGTV